MFLTRENLIELVGSARKSVVKRWLTKEGIPFVLGIDGWPRVLCSVVEARMGGLTQPKREPRLHFA